MIKVVFIDIDNTLLDFDEGARQSIKNTCAEFGIEYSDIMFDTFQSVNNELWRRLERGELTRERLHEIRWGLIFAQLGISADAAAFEGMFFEGLTYSAVPIDGAAEALKYLSGKYTVCVASNASHGHQAERMREAGLEQYVDKFFVSADIGADKPSKRFFDLCFDRLPPCRPDEAIMIGDSLTADMRGGADYGMRTCWYNPHAADSVDWVDYTVTDLRQIEQIL
ncbi:MAG: YjjG family noncanonical pyrimidine nucleotidase [Firmicutes bacterium]|nr:YjjG family noncanonical pyrimidine nucleotidase [Bacillota bacterium]